MSTKLIPPTSSTALSAPQREPYGVGNSWAAEPEPVEATPQWRRLLDAVLRHRWIAAAATLAGLGIGIALSLTSKPKYEARATIWISESTNEEQRRGPIRAGELLANSAWIELLRSFAIVDAVVLRERLYLTPSNSADSLAFAGFGHEEPLVPGRYELRVGREATTWELADTEGIVVDRGAVGDSIGRRLGFRWAPSAEQLRGRRSVAFVVQLPREASIDLLRRVNPALPENSNFMRVTLSGEDPRRVANTLNLWLHEFVAVAAEVKKRNTTEFAKILQGQLEYAARSLRDAEYALQAFRVGTVTLPSEGNPVAPGLEQTRDPVFNSFFEQKVEHDRVRRDREALQQLLASNGGAPEPGSFYAIPGLLADPGAEQLKQAISEYFEKQAKLRALQQTYTDEFQSVVQAREQLASLKSQTIPAFANALLDNLRRREVDMNGRIESASRDMRTIPTRTIEEMRLRREVTVAENLYTTLQSRYEEAKLAEASAVPDVSVLDAAMTPQRPASNLGQMLIAIGLLGGLGAGVVLAILMDRLDPRFRYTMQATGELGLQIIGAVPTIRRSRSVSIDLEHASQIVESFRSIRLHVAQSYEPQAPVTVTISSAGEHEGKSLISSNLALSFAEGGYRTVLVDGDTRRGEQHVSFGVPQSPGLLDLLAGECDLEPILQPTAHDRLTVVTCGQRRYRGPELLASQSMARLVAELAARFDVVIVDSPPLSAGIDAYALGAATGNLVMVLRAGTTDRRLAQVKLRTADRFPIRILGAVLNDVRTTDSEFRYYSYTYSYRAEDEPMPQLASSVGEVRRPG